MNIKGHEIPQYVIESYLRACRYNQEVGTKDSDWMQRDCHQKIIEIAGLNIDDPDYNKFCLTIDKLVDDLLRDGY